MIASLREIQLLEFYRTVENDIVRDFYHPCLSVASTYQRAVGYFTSHSLTLAARGLVPFAKRGGVLRLIASPHITEADALAIDEGYALRAAVDKAVQIVIDEILSWTSSRAPEILSALISSNRLDIKLAVPVTKTATGLYHEKFGLFRDAAGDTVAFVGSANETTGGLLTNFESIEVFRSWVPIEQSRVERRHRDFQDLWNGNTKGIRIYEFPEEAKQILRTYRPDATISSLQDDDDIDFLPAIDDINVQNITLFEYQTEAINSWFRAGGRGYWRMATGTGKTITALSAIRRASDAVQHAGSSLMTVVLVPYQHLVSQWAEEAARFGLSPVLCFRSRNRWLSALTDRIRHVNSGVVHQAMAIATYATFCTDAFQNRLQAIKSPLLLVVDEVHNAGSESLRQLLPQFAQYRLGLSATPERWFDDSGTAAIREYFGEETFSLGLKDAIEKKKALTPYRYYVHLVTLTDDEAERYIEITNQISKYSAIRDIDGDSDDEQLKRLLIRRARIIALAANKLQALATAITPTLHSCHNLVYCGDGSVEFGSDGEMMRQVDAAVQMLGDLGVRVNSYTADTEVEDRIMLRDMFSSCALQYLVAIRCLDEGVDIPSTQRAFILASSTNPKQFIQRRGRVLRKHPGKEYAEIHDFLTVLPKADAESADAERALARRELRRVALFADLASNGPQVKHALLPLYEQYNALDLLTTEEFLQ